MNNNRFRTEHKMNIAAFNSWAILNVVIIRDPGNPAGGGGEERIQNSDYRVSHPVRRMCEK